MWPSAQVEEHKETEYGIDVSPESAGAEAAVNLKMTTR